MANFNLNDAAGRVTANVGQIGVPVVGGVVLKEFLGGKNTDMSLLADIIGDVAIGVGGAILVKKILDPPVTAARQPARQMQRIQQPQPAPIKAQQPQDNTYTPWGY